LIEETRRSKQHSPPPAASNSCTIL
jgi:hypothetical protein